MDTTDAAAKADDALKAMTRSRDNWRFGAIIALAIITEPLFRPLWNFVFRF